MLDNKYTPGRRLACLCPSRVKVFGKKKKKTMVAENGSVFRDDDDDNDGESSQSKCVKKEKREKHVVRTSLMEQDC